MKGRHPGFPLTAVLVVPPALEGSENLVAILGIAFRKLRDRTRFGLLIVHSGSERLAQQIGEAAKEAEVKCQRIEGSEVGDPTDSTAGLTAAGMELVETSDLFLAISTETPTESVRDNNELLAYAQGLGRPVVRIDARTGAIDAENLPEQIESDQSWLPELFQIAGLSPDANLETIKAGMSAAANRAAPLTRRWWKWILVLEGIAVLAPLAWLARRQVDLALTRVAVITFGAVILLIATNWWLRWRAMQTTWARARLVAEIARSLLATASCPGPSRASAFTLVPALRSLRWIPNPAPALSFPAWRDSYIENRIDDQARYFKGKQEQAEIERKRLSRWTTLWLDIALAFGFAGLALAVIPAAWVKVLGDARLEVMLGLGGVAMPVALLLAQMLRAVRELNRRTARYAQQSQMLRQAKARLMSLTSPQIAMEVVADTEQQLLAEVFEWYFHAETAEHFFQARRAQAMTGYVQLKQKQMRPGGRIAAAFLVKSELTGLFLLRVILGRVPWIVASAAAVVIWLNYYNQRGVDSERLKEFVELRDRAWNPSSEKASNGCVIFVHGLWGAVTPSGKAKAWMKECAETIETTLGPKAPNTGLVDWSVPAKPSAFNRISSGLGIADFLGDIAGVRPQAQQVGDVLAEQLAALIQTNSIRKDRPLHLIGHSAGGFVVARAAIRLSEKGLAPAPMHVTILDTPAPDDEVLFVLPNKCPVDFYISSPIGGMVPIDDIVQGVRLLAKTHKLWKRADFSAPNMHMVDIPAGNGMGVWEAHREAYNWFKTTIGNPASAPGEGFNRSPVFEAAAAR